MVDRISVSSDRTAEKRKNICLRNKPRVKVFRLTPPPQTSSLQGAILCLTYYLVVLMNLGMFGVCHIIILIIPVSFLN